MNNRIATSFYTVQKCKCVSSDFLFFKYKHNMIMEHGILLYMIVLPCKSSCVLESGYAVDVMGSRREHIINLQCQCFTSLSFYLSLSLPLEISSFPWVYKSSMSPSSFFASSLTLVFLPTAEESTLPSQNTLLQSDSSFCSHVLPVSIAPCILRSPSLASYFSLDLFLEHRPANGIHWKLRANLGTIYLDLIYVTKRYSWE